MDSYRAPIRRMGLGAFAGLALLTAGYAAHDNTSGAAPPAPAACEQQAAPREAAPTVATGYVPSAYPNVNVRLAPNSYRAPGGAGASIYVRPGVDPRSIRRAPVRPAEMPPERIISRPDGSAIMMGSRAHMNTMTARVGPDRTVEVGCSVKEGDR